MKVLFDHPSPFFLAHGGLQIQIQQTKAALTALDVEVEFIRWWDENQRGEIIHYFGRPPSFYLDLAHKKGFKVVVADLLGGLGARSTPMRVFQRTLMRSANWFLPGQFLVRMAWDAYRKADACVALTAWEGRLMQSMFSANREQIQVIPNGVEDVFLNSSSLERGPWLVCVATIAEVKRVLELAKAAIDAKTPVWFIGKSYADASPYVQKFYELAKSHPRFVRYEGPSHDRSSLARAYREARGFVLLSRWESLSISALEAAACGCPLLLSDLPWAQSVFGSQVRYCPISAVRQTARALRSFYDAAPSLTPPPRPLSWLDVGQKLKELYLRLATTSR